MERNCDQCGTPYLPQRSSSRYCTPRCRTRATRARKAEAANGPGVVQANTRDLRVVRPSRPAAGAPAAPPRPPAEDQSWGVLGAVLTKLREVGRLDTVAGQQVVALARRLENSTMDTGSSYAALSKELRTTMAEVLADVEDADDPVNAFRDNVREFRRA